MISYKVLVSSLATSKKVEFVAYLGTDENGYHICRLIIIEFKKSKLSASTFLKDYLIVPNGNTLHVMSVDNSVFIKDVASIVVESV